MQPSQVMESSHLGTVELTQEISNSGEGKIYRTSIPGQLAKIYHEPTENRRAKIEVMLISAPVDPNLKLNHLSWAWPTSMLFDSQKFVGFLMPEIVGGLGIVNIYNPLLRQKKQLQIDWQFLHAVALNLASLVGALHSCGHVLADLKPENILVNNRGLPTLVDTDSFQIRNPKTHQVFRCPVGSLEYTPVELLDRDFAAITQVETSDRFRLASIVYLLLFGTPHYAGKWLRPGDPPSPQELLKLGYWIGREDRVIAPAAVTVPFDTVHPGLQRCFRRCFNAGHLVPSQRPTAIEWYRVLSAAFKDLQLCQNSRHHYYSSHSLQCVWCDRAQKLKFDIFELNSPNSRTNYQIKLTQVKAKVSAHAVHSLLKLVGEQVEVKGVVSGFYDSTKTKYNYFALKFCGEDCFEEFRLNLSAKFIKELNLPSPTDLNLLKHLAGQEVRAIGIVSIKRRNGFNHPQIILDSTTDLQVANDKIEVYLKNLAIILG